MHGTENDLFLFTMGEGLETGANHVVESLHRAVEHKKRELEKLPPKLFVQADNCTRENKNRYFMGYLGMLVARGVFVEAQMSALEVGLTHTDIDQTFSCVHRRLDKNAAFSLRQLHEELQQSYSPTPHVEELSQIDSFSELCESSKVLNNVARFTQNRYFRFQRRGSHPENGFYDTKVNVKRRISDEWMELPLPRNRVGGFLKSCPDLLSFPNTKTEVLPNVREVNACLKAAEARIRSDDIMEDLYALRDRVYTAREQQGHWNETCFELNGDFTPGSVCPETQSLSQSMVNLPLQESGRYRYEIGQFVAIKPEERYNTPFWIAEIAGFGALDEEGYPGTLKVRWYVAGPGDDPFMVTYKPGVDNGLPWLAEIGVETVMLRFDSLTRRNRLHRDTANKLSRGLLSG